MRWLRIAGFITVGVVVACGGRIDTFKVQESGETVVEQGTVLEQLVGGLGFADFVQFDIAQTEEFQNQGAKKSQIDSIYLTLLRLEITDPPSGQDLTFVESVEFYVEAEGLDRVRVASGGPFEAGQTVTDLDLDGVDLAPYATAPSMDITTEVTGHRPANDTTIEGTIELLVDVNVGGVLCGG